MSVFLGFLRFLLNRLISRTLSPMRLVVQSASVHNGSPLCITDRTSLLNIQLGLMRTRQQLKTSAGTDLGLEKLGIGVMLYAYAVLLGASYLFAFWRPFGFNVLPYLGLQDYVSAPLNRVLVLVATPLVFAAVIFGRHPSDLGSRSRELSWYLVALYGIAFVKEFYQAVTRYVATDFHFANETTVLAIATLLFGAGVTLAYYSHRALQELPVQIAALVLVQSSVSMAAGYSDGKAIYNGAAQVHYLGNKELCESGGVRDWVFLGSFGGQTFFMNTIDKRLCLTDQKNIRLVSRQVKEGL